MLISLVGSNSVLEQILTDLKLRSRTYKAQSFSTAFSILLHGFLVVKF